MKRVVTISLPVLGFGLLVIGGYLGLVWAPPEREMGDVYRIMYVHVPAAWMSLLAFTVTFVASVAFLFSQSRWGWDALAEASAEVGVLFTGLLLCLGSIWARPTWGVWWQWDPRLTTAAIMLVAFVGYLVLRRFVNDAGRRATWSSVVAIVSFVDIPIVYFSVKWWNSIHQMQSSPSTVDRQMVIALRTNAFAFLFIMIWFIRQRYLIAKSRLAEDIAPPPLAVRAPAAVSGTVKA
jgi:heme exporter protein C